MIVLDLIRSSLRSIAGLGPGQGAGASELVDALFVLNSMLDQWNVERLNVYAIATVSIALTPGTTAYTATPRPVRLEDAFIVNGTARTQLGVLNREQYLRNLPGVYLDTAYPTASVKVNAAIGAGDVLELGVWAPLTAFAATSDVVALPPGYADAIRYNLAVRLASEWHKELRPDVVELARSTKAALQSLNAPDVVMSCDPAVLGPGNFNISTGRF